VAVLGVLGMFEDLSIVASDDELGKKLQDIKLKGRKKQGREQGEKRFLFLLIGENLQNPHYL